MNENVGRTIGELAAIGGIHPHNHGDEGIEVHPASPALALIAAEILKRAGFHELQPGVWGIEDENGGSS